LKLNDELAAINKALDAARSIVKAGEAGVSAIIQAEKEVDALATEFLSKCGEVFTNLVPPENAVQLVFENDRVGFLAYVFMGDSGKTDSLNSNFGRGEGVVFEFGNELTPEEKKDPDAVMKICQQQVFEYLLKYLLDTDKEVFYWCVPITKTEVRK